MVSPKPSAGWQLEELRRFLEANKNDPLLGRRPVRLVNPEDIRFSDGLILDRLTSRHPSHAQTPPHA